MALTFIRASVNDNCNGQLMSIVKDIEFQLWGKGDTRNGFTFTKSDSGEYTQRISNLQAKSLTPFSYLRATLKLADGKEADMQSLELSKATQTSDGIKLDFIFNCQTANIPRDTKNILAQSIVSPTESKSEKVVNTNNNTTVKNSSNTPAKKKKTWLYVLLGVTAVFGIYFYTKRKK
jgi:hypothetical protein